MAPLTGIIGIINVFSDALFFGRTSLVELVELELFKFNYTWYNFIFTRMS